MFIFTVLRGIKKEIKIIKRSQLKVIIRLNKLKTRNWRIIRIIKRTRNKQKKWKRNWKLTVKIFELEDKLMKAHESVKG